MAAPRATQFIALRNLSRGAQQVRSLHMTGPATYASPVLIKERPVLNLPRDIAGLRAECKRRKIETSGSKQDLISRLQADELSHSRAFSTATSNDSSKRPTPSSTSSSSTPPTRHFNTSRTLKAVGDTSTIDFAYLPTSALSTVEPEILRVPILPDNYTTPSQDPSIADQDVVVMKPQISTMSADAVFLPMSELTDGHAMNIDFHAMADRVAANLRVLGEKGLGVEEQASIMKRVWGDLVDDVVKALAGRKGAA